LNAYLLLKHMKGSQYGPYQSAPVRSAGPR
jgi:hypothetical protein